MLEGPASEGAQRFHLTTARVDGKFFYEGLPPGSYRLAAVDAQDYWEFLELGSLGAYEQTAEKIELHEAGKVSRNLKKR